MNQAEVKHGEEAREAGEARQGPAQGQLDGPANPEGKTGLGGGDGAHSPGQNDRSRNSVGQPREDSGNQVAGYVYIVGVLEGCHKIGRSVDPHGRLSQFAPLLPRRLEVVHAIQTANPKWLEIYLHDVFFKCRVGGEWFQLDRYDIQLLKSMDGIHNVSCLPRILRDAELGFARTRPNYTPTITTNPFGEELSRLIVEKDLTQKAVAEACGVNQTFIGKLIRGERDRLGSDILFKLCDVLDVGCDHFRPFLAGPPATAPQPAKGRRK